MNKQTEALKLALEALELCNGAETADGIVVYTGQEITAIKEALVQPVQKPDIYPEEAFDMGLEAVAYYATPPKREWIGLTDEEVKNLWLSVGAEPIEVRLIEAKLKEKNA